MINIITPHLLLTICLNVVVSQNSLSGGIIPPGVGGMWQIRTFYPPPPPPPAQNINTGFNALEKSAILDQNQNLISLPTQIQSSYHTYVNQIAQLVDDPPQTPPQTNCSLQPMFELKKTVLQQFCDISNFDDLRKLETSEVKACCQVNDFLLEQVDIERGGICMCGVDLNSSFGLLVDVWRLICQSEKPYCDTNQTQALVKSVAVEKREQDFSVDTLKNLDTGNFQQVENEEIVSIDKRESVLIPGLNISVGSLLESVTNASMLEAMEGIRPLSIAYDLLKQLGLGNTLTQKPVTMFVPTNDAFDRFARSQGLAVEMLPSLQGIQDIIQYHIISGEQEVGDVQNSRTFTTWQGSNMSVRSSSAGVEGQVNLFATGCCNVSNFAFVVVADAKTNDGVLQIIDSVLLPPNN